MSAALAWLRSVREGEPKAPECLTDAPVPPQVPLVIIVERGDELFVTSPWVKVFAEKVSAIAGRIDVAQGTSNTMKAHVPVARRKALWKYIVASFPKGTVVVGKRGRTTL